VRRRDGARMAGFTATPWPTFGRIDVSPVAWSRDVSEGAVTRASRTRVWHMRVWGEVPQRIPDNPTRSRMVSQGDLDLRVILISG
jgi:hypothetical protein